MEEKKDYSENCYKLQIAKNLIIFLLNIQMHNFPLEEKTEHTNLILESWEKKVNKKLELMIEDNILKISKSTGMGKDEAKIISDIFQIENNIIRKEFKREIRETTFQSYERGLNVK